MAILPPWWPEISANTEKCREAEPARQDPDHMAEHSLSCTQTVDLCSVLPRQYSQPFPWGLGCHVNWFLSLATRRVLLLQRAFRDAGPVPGILQPSLKGSRAPDPRS